VLVVYGAVRQNKIMTVAVFYALESQQQPIEKS
jgi:hypothetical protein